MSGYSATSGSRNVVRIETPWPTRLRSDTRTRWARSASATRTTLALGPADQLLEVGCGGGLLLHDALVTGASVTGLDNSEEMVALARERAPGADVVLAKAERLPFADGAFSAIAMSVVFFFLEDPVGVLRECRRVLRRGGRVAVYTTGPELRGTPAAPEPIASEGHFYRDQELAELARAAQLREVSVRNERGGQLLTARA